ncbi:MAG: hypothetical protein PHT95_05200 [Candidatus Omnitrophica bacterium]|nr:hypothetical protein [Candidatus Omnitrophota bacterium]
MEKMKMLVILAVLAWIMTIELNADVMAVSGVQISVIELNDASGISSRPFSEKGLSNAVPDVCELSAALGIPTIARPDWGELEDSLLSIKGAHMSA